ncbi:NUDIX hydrolase [Aliiroseovarius sp. Z3]|uniref:NUDIX hydrolase n=1 Tax=Aliiroseovarius sp. Z3 TaxID=2811402 RepID=UPI0023B2E2D1|nr:NUDIX hydrolase [Aliiroseovarius sp. Z3]MDE9450419.1 NUDIX hydrolase [Aliiroseovarius sp. Z3]
MEYSGAKLVLLIGGQVATLLRDNFDHIPYPDMWDFPGGGNDPGETPEQCVLRETYEELGLRLTKEDLIWRRPFDSPVIPGTKTWWFAASLPQSRAQDIVFGEEGQCWALMEPSEWLSHPKAIAHFKPRLQAALAAIADQNIEYPAK